MWNNTLYSDLTELDLPSTMKTEFADPADLLNFTLTITPDDGTYSHSPSSCYAYTISIAGMYKGGWFLFTFKINANYPHVPPKVKCEQKVCPVPQLSGALFIVCFPDLSSER